MIGYSLLIVTSLTLPVLIFSYQYQILYDDERIFKPCEKDPDHHITQFLDITNLTFEDVSDEETIINGYFSISAAVELEDTLNFDVSILKQVAGKYQQPAGQLIRKDFCQVFFDPSEIWFIFSSSIAENYRKCPVQQGTVFLVDHWSSKSTTLNLPDPNFSGAYLITVTLKDEQKENLYFCVELYVHSYRM